VELNGRRARGEESSRRWCCWIPSYLCIRRLTRTPFLRGSGCSSSMPTPQMASSWAISPSLARRLWSPRPLGKRSLSNGGLLLCDLARQDRSRNTSRGGGGGEQRMPNTASPTVRAAGRRREGRRRRTIDAAGRGRGAAASVRGRRRRVAGGKELNRYVV
jgi:hypothetical protein